MKTFLLLTLCLLWMIELEPTNPVAIVPFITICATLLFGTLSWLQVHSDKAHKPTPPVSKHKQRKLRAARNKRQWRK